MHMEANIHMVMSMKEEMISVTKTAHKKEDKILCIMVVVMTMNTRMMIMVTLMKMLKRRMPEMKS